MAMEQVPAYSLAERDRRWALARELMAAEGVDALLVYGERELHYPERPAHDAYFTNDRPGSIVLFCRDADPVMLVDTPLTVANHLAAHRRGEPAWVAAHNLRVTRHPGGVVGVLREHGLLQARIGVIGADPSPRSLQQLVPAMPNGLWDALLGSLPYARLIGVYEAFRARAAAQSAEEQAALAYAARAGDEVVQAMLEAIKPGRTEADVMAAGVAEAYRHGIGAPALTLQSGPGSLGWGGPAYAYRPQLPRTLAEGDMLLAEVFCSFGLRESRQPVSIAVGDPAPDVERAARVARSAYDAGLGLLRPGNVFGDVVEVMRWALLDAGGWNLHPIVRALYPFGPISAWSAGVRDRPDAHDYGRITEVPTAGAATRLVPGTAFSLAPNVVLGEHAVSLGGTVVVGETDPIELNPFTAQLLRA